MMSKAVGDAYSAFEQPGSPAWVYTESGASCSRLFRGSLSALQQMRPEIGSNMFGLVVRRVEIESYETDSMGEMRISMDDYSDPWEIGTDNEQTIEVEWSQIERPIEQHKSFASLSDEQLRDIESALRGEKEDSEITDATAKKLLAKKRRGQISYLVFAPVIRRTSKSSYRPGTTSCGKIDNPPVSIGGYKFLKSADRATRTTGEARWTRSEEWLGADDWDQDIYK